MLSSGMAPPPVTPAPSRFLLPSKRHGTQPSQGLIQTPNQPPVVGPHHFHVTPRFSSASTPRSSNVAGTALTPTIPPLTVKTDRPSRSRLTQDVIDDESPLDSSRDFPAASPTGRHAQLPEPIEFASSFISQSPSQVTDEPDVITEDRSAKRRRISITSSEPDTTSPGLSQAADDQVIDITTSPPLPAAISEPDSDDVLATSPHDLDSNLNVDSDVDLPIHSLDPPSPSPSSSPRQQHAQPQQQPTFHPPPRFKLPSYHPPAAGADEIPPPDIFSPQRRGGARYVPGGLASELRDWLVEIKESDAEQIRSHAAVRLLVDSVRDGGLGMTLVAGRPVVTDERGGLGPPARAILAGQGTVEGLGAGGGNRPGVAPGVVVVVKPPAWDVELGQRWAVAYRWEVGGQDGAA